ncbi:MAG: hypothetical protein LBR64_09795 [Dysgonamonadaceae bacterium]|jgi:hypothetical protein|nr:hypothetical protein [Dysgonamonadaceae bacterium]
MLEEIDNLHNSMIMKYLIFILLLLFCDTTNDKVSKTVSDFYEWYIYAIHNLPDEEYQPSVVFDDAQKMYKLKTEKYQQNLVKYNFSDAFVKRELLNSEQCAENLTKNTKKLEDIADYEDINCDFIFNYRWLNKSQEIVDGIEIIEIKTLRENEFLVVCKFYIIDNQTKEKEYQDYKSVVSVKKHHKQYKIENIEFI